MKNEQIRFRSKNHYSADLKRYYTSDPIRAAFLVARGCRHTGTDTNNAESIIFELEGDTPDTIPGLIHELHSGTPFTKFLEAYNLEYNKLRSIIRDTLDLAHKRGAGAGS